MLPVSFVLMLSATWQPVQQKLIAQHVGLIHRNLKAMVGKNTAWLTNLLFCFLGTTDIGHPTQVMG